MNGETLWNMIVARLSDNDEELQTITGLWFLASSDGQRLFVDKSINNAPSSQISKQRVISKKDFLFVHSFYERWLSREKGVRHEVSRKSRNTAYIFALIEKFTNN